MPLPTLIDIQEVLTEYLSGRISLREFDEHFLRLAWDIETETNSELAVLRAEVLLLLSEYTAGHRTEEELRTLLRRLTSNHPARTRH